MARSKQPVLAGMLEKARQFFEELPVEGVSPRPLLQKLRTTGLFLWLVWRGFSVNRCPVRAAALSYTTLLALVPLLAVALSFSKNILHDSSAELVPKLMDRVVQMVAPQLELMPLDDSEDAVSAEGQVVVSSRARQQAVEKIQTFLDHINAGALGVVGSIFLVFVAIRLLMTIEQTFNDIWGVGRGRSIWRKVVYYWTTVTLGPLLLLLAIYLTGRAEFLGIVGTLKVVPGFEKLLLHLTPFVVLWIAFSLMYALMPNTRVRLQAAIAGGIFGGTLWQLNNLLSTLYVSRVVTYSKIYGTIGIIPLLLVGLYFSWLIVLLGAQVSYAAQNIRNYLQQRASERIDQQGRELIACRAVLLACHRFLRGLRPPTVEELAESINAPPQWLNQLLFRLIEGGLLCEVADEQLGLVPARPPDSITIADVLDVVRTGSGIRGATTGGHDGELVKTLLGELSAAQHAAPANLRFSDLAAQLDAANS